MSRETKWFLLVCGFLSLVVAILLGLVLTGKLQGTQRNLLTQAIFGAAMVITVLGAAFIRFRAERLPAPPARLGIVALSLVAMVLIGLYFYRTCDLLLLPYDLGGWSEPDFMLDIVKYRTGQPLYLNPDDSNSNNYTFGASALSYALASLAGRPTSIPFYRILDQFYLVLAALFAAAATGQLLRLLEPARFARVPRYWYLFFAVAAFLFCTNTETTSLNIFIHNEQPGLLLTAISFWLMTRHAVTRDSRLLWGMTVLPVLGFFVKQNQIVWLGVYVVYLWLQREVQPRQIVKMAAGCLLLWGGALAVCFAVWGSNFRYWVFQLLGGFIVSVPKMLGRIVDAGWYLVLGALCGLVLLRGTAWRRLLSIYVGWIVLVLVSAYGLGMAPYTTYLGPATLVSACFFLAAIATSWPEAGESTEPLEQQWTRLALGFVLVLLVFAGLGHPYQNHMQVSPDFHRYVQEIEREFEGQPADKVLLDIGEWIYLRKNILMKDRAPLVAAHRTPHYGIIERIRHQEYSRIIVHHLPRRDQRLLYDLGDPRGIGDALSENYRVVRRIAGVKGMENWRYDFMTLRDISVFEPIPRENISPPNPSAAPVR